MQSAHGVRTHGLVDWGLTNGAGRSDSASRSATRALGEFERRPRTCPPFHTMQNLPTENSASDIPQRSRQGLASTLSQHTRKGAGANGGIAKVTRACDRKCCPGHCLHSTWKTTSNPAIACRTRRVRCSGHSPCPRCVDAGYLCTFSGTGKKRGPPRKDAGIPLATGSSGSEGADDVSLCSLLEVTTEVEVNKHGRRWRFFCAVLSHQRWI